MAIPLELVSRFIRKTEKGTLNVPVNSSVSSRGGLHLFADRYNADNVLAGAHGMNLKSMNINALIGLRNKIDAVLESKVAGERRALETELAKLTRYESGPRARSVGGRGGTRGKVAPKYRNPDDPQETWAGRGLKPRWLAAAIKAGHKLEDFEIAGAGKDGGTKPVKRRGRIKRK